MIINHTYIYIYIYLFIYLSIDPIYPIYPNVSLNRSPKIPWVGFLHPSIPLYYYILFWDYVTYYMGLPENKVPQNQMVYDHAPFPAEAIIGGIPNYHTYAVWLPSDNVT